MLRKILIFLAGLVTGWFPPEAIVMLMEPPPGKGRALRRAEPVPIRRHPMSDTGMRHRHHHMRRKTTPPPH